jgi:MYXO-CTERM domain-containing protein
VDTPSHTIAGVDLSPTAGRVVTRVEVSKTSAAQTLIFWGATGVATSPIDGGAADGTPDAVADTGAIDAGLPADVPPASVDVAAAVDASIVDASVFDASVVDAADAAAPQPPAGVTSGCAVAGDGDRSFAWILLLVMIVAGRRRR